MKKQVLFAALLALGTAHADILIQGAASQTFDRDAGVEEKNDWTLTDNGSSPSLASGESWSVQFKVTVNSTSDSADPVWANGNSMEISFIDRNSATRQGIGMQLDLVGSARVRIGGDASAGAAGTFGLLSSDSPLYAVSSVDGTSGDLKNVGDVGYFTFSATNTGTGSNDLTLVWSDGGVNQDTFAWTTGDTPLIDSLDRMSVGIPVLDSATQTANLTVEVIPEPATLGLIASVGLGLIGLRRFFMV